MVTRVLSFIQTQAVAVYPIAWSTAFQSFSIGSSRKKYPIGNEGRKGRVIFQGHQIPRVEHTDFIFTNVTLRRKDKNISMKILQGGEDKKILIPYPQHVL